MSIERIETNLRRGVFLITAGQPYLAGCGFSEVVYLATTAGTSSRVRIGGCPNHPALGLIRRRTTLCCTRSSGIAFHSAVGVQSIKQIPGLVLRSGIFILEDPYFKDVFGRVVRTPS